MPREEKIIILSCFTKKNFVCVCDLKDMRSLNRHNNPSSFYLKHFFLFLGGGRWRSGGAIGRKASLSAVPSIYLITEMTACGQRGHSCWCGNSSLGMSKMFWSEILKWGLYGHIKSILRKYNLEILLWQGSRSLTDFGGIPALCFLLASTKILEYNIATRSYVCWVYSNLKSNLAKWCSPLHFWAYTFLTQCLVYFLFWKKK